MRGSSGPTSDESPTTRQEMLKWLEGAGMERQRLLLSIGKSVASPAYAETDLMVCI